MFFFSAVATDSGRELYASDGVTSWQVTDIAPGAETSSVETLGEVNGYVIFAATDDLGVRAIWSSDGTQGGTQRLCGLPAGSSSYVSVAEMAGALFLSIYSLEGSTVIRTAGTAETTANVLDGTSWVDSLHEVAGGMLFVAHDQNYASTEVPQTGRVVFLDGDGNLNTILEISGQYVSGAYLEAVYPVGNGLAFLIEVDGERQLWSAADAHRPAIRLFADVTLYSVDPVGDGLVVMTVDGSGPFSLWTTDGSLSGSHVVAQDTYPMSIEMGPLEQSDGNRGYFITGSGSETVLWVTDGSASGTEHYWRFPMLSMAITKYRVSFSWTAARPCLSEVTTTSA